MSQRSETRKKINITVQMAIMNDWSHLRILDRSSVLQVYSYPGQEEISAEAARESHRNREAALLGNEPQLVVHGTFSAGWNRSNANVTDKQSVAHTGPVPTEHVYSIATNAESKKSDPGDGHRRWRTCFAGKISCLIGLTYIGTPATDLMRFQYLWSPSKGAHWRKQ